MVRVASYSLIILFAFALPIQAQPVHYRGKILDETGAPISGAAVKVEGSSSTIQSGADGSFNFSGALALRTGRNRPNMAPAPSMESDRGLLANGRRLKPGVLAYGRFLSRADDRLTSTALSPAAKPAAAARSSIGGFAAAVLVVTRSGFSEGRFSQSRDTALNLSLTLTRLPASGTYAAEKKVCLDEVNKYRATVGLKALAWSAALEAYADEGAKYDAARNQAHAHFSAVNPNPADAENEIPDWPLRNYANVSAIVVAGTKMMWEEGPGGGHYENIKGSHTTLGCGIHVTAAGAVWIIQDFR